MAELREAPRKNLNRRVSVPDDRGIKVVKSCTINRPAEELYQFWRRLENLPRFMNNLVSITSTSEHESHWIVKSPSGKNVEWDAVIINEHPNNLIAWRTRENSDVAHAGSIRFEPAPGGRGTEVTVTFEYEAPGGKIGATLAKVTGKEPGQQTEKDLLAFKALMETGEIPTTKGQPKGEK